MASTCRSGMRAPVGNRRACCLVSSSASAGSEASTRRARSSKAPSEMEGSVGDGGDDVIGPSPPEPDGSDALDGASDSPRAVFGTPRLGATSARLGGVSTASAPGRDAAPGRACAPPAGSATTGAVRRARGAPGTGSSSGPEAGRSPAGDGSARAGAGGSTTATTPGDVSGFGKALPATPTVVSPALAMTREPPSSQMAAAFSDVTPVEPAVPALPPPDAAEPAPPAEVTAVAAPTRPQRTAAWVALKPSTLALRNKPSSTSSLGWGGAPSPLPFRWVFTAAPPPDPARHGASPAPPSGESTPSAPGNPPRRRPLASEVARSRKARLPLSGRRRAHRAGGPTYRVVREARSLGAGPHRILPRAARPRRLRADADAFAGN